MLGEKRGQSLFRPPEEFKETEQEMGTSETGEESAKTEIRPEEMLWSSFFVTVMANKIKFIFLLYTVPRTVSYIHYKSVDGHDCMSHMQTPLWRYSAPHLCGNSAG